MMLNNSWRLLNRLVRVGLLGLVASLALPAMAEESCRDLGIHTVNWKSPDDNQRGVLVVQVQPGCVAAGLGVATGDLITGFNGEPIASQYDLERLAGSHAAEQAFTLTLRDGKTGTSQTLHREALPAQAGTDPAHEAIQGVASDWLPWFKWAGLFLVLTLIVTPAMWWALRHHTPDVMLGGAIGGVYGEYADGGKRYVTAGIQGALAGLVGLIIFILIGPVGFIYALYQPLTATLSDADVRLCCVEQKGQYALSPDGRWLAMVKPTPERYFGLGDKIARTPYVAALADLRSGQFVAWRDAVDERWRGVEPSAGSDLRRVFFDDEAGQPYIHWRNGFATPLAPSDQTVPGIGPAPRPDLRYRMIRAETERFIFADAASGETLILRPGQAYDKWWLSADGRVLALATRPYQPDPNYDGWLTRAWYAVRNFVIDDWTVSFFDVGGKRKLATYSGYGYDGARWDDGRFLEASLDGRRWVMVRDNGFVLVFDLTDKLMSGSGTGQTRAPLYLAPTGHNEIAFHRESDTPSPENLQRLAAMAGRYPSEILEQHPELAEALKRTLGQSHAPLMDMLTVEMPARATPDGGLAFTQCKAHACYDGTLVVYVSPSFEVSALLFHNDGEIDLPETPAQGETNPDNWSRLVLYQAAAHPLKMAWGLYEAARTDLDGMEPFALNDQRGQVSHRFWVIGRLP